MNKRELVKLKNEKFAYDKILSKVASNLEIPDSEVKEIMVNALTWLKKELSNPTNDKILFNHFGSFGILKNKVIKANNRGNIKPDNNILNLIKSE
jgi:nucleoid DNA-binding protein